MTVRWSSHRAPLLLVAVVAVLMGEVGGHVALTYPPARKYDLDFLDNGRTQGPCGMPKGNTSTMLVQGSSLDVTWHLAYPHQGGYRLELLDQDQRVVTDLTNPDGETLLVEGDPTAQSHRITLPKDTLCSGCTLRLLRQAVEWGPSYQFWSCADVDIVKRRFVHEKCSGNGNYLVDKCRCTSGYYGAACQYSNECEVDADCGVYGKCIDIDATTYPKKQCYCQQGRFGPKCANSSLLRLPHQVNLNLFTKKELSPKLSMYYRVLRNQDKDEIEVALVGNGTSYLAVGWRPSSATTACRQFPHITGELGGDMWKQQDNALLTAIKEKSSKAKPEPSASGEPEPSAEGEPEPSAEGEPEPSPKAEPEPSAEGEPEPSAEAEPEPSGGGKPKPVSEGKPEPEPEPKSEPEPNTKPEPESGAVVPERATEAQTTKPGQSSQGDADSTEKPPSLADRLSGLLVPSRGKRDAPQLQRRRNRRFAVPLLKSEGNETKSGEEVLKSAALQETKPEPESEAEPQKLSGDSPWVPRGKSLHAMDCTDVVVGMAFGNSYRIMDYYTRDRSTPRPDDFWGGEDSLTAALGWEKDGITTIVFRKPLQATHPSDQPIEPGLMHVIWAMGQESGRYVHIPPSGLEKGGNASVPDFYKRNELKYHGKGDQRGVASVDIIGTSKAPGTSASAVNWCGGEFGYPGGCSVKNQTCQYHARWEYLDDDSDLVHYTVTSKFPNRWTGIGFSDNTRMAQTDVVVGFVGGNGDGTIFDGWLVGYSGVTMDRLKSITDESAKLEDGIVTLDFKKKRNNNDKEHDLAFDDDKCLYLVYPVGGGAFSQQSKRLSKHSSTPLFSTERVCIRSCSAGRGQNATGIIYTTTPKPPQLLYEAEVLFSGYKDFVVPSQQDPKFQTLAERFKSNIVPSLKNLPGYEDMEIESLAYKAPGSIMAKFEISLDKAKHEEAGALPALVKDTGSGNAMGSKVYDALQNSVSKGTVGALPVNATFLKVNQLLVSNPSRQTDSGISEEQPTASTAGVGWNMSFKEFLNINKTWIIVGVVVALILIALMQLIVTIVRKKKRQNNAVATPKSKGPLVTNSGFKDYSRGNLNYAYETFETAENGVNGRRLSGNGTSGGRGYSRSNGGMNHARGGSPMRETREHHNNHSYSNNYQDTYNSGHHHSHKSSHGGNGPLHHYNTQPSGTSVGDTRSLQRPRQPPATRDRGWSTSGMPDPRTTYSLPRGAHAAPAGYDRNPMAENTPDFYYLPSQRKYSGEVVRVYVDYNKAK